MNAAARPEFLAITGPTASGKTALSLAVAGRVGAEIVSMDSRQVYRGMDVGTDKADRSDRERVPHHGLDLIDPDERYSAGRFARDARRWIEEIEGRGRVPLLVGGTGFFLRALLEPMFAEPELDEGRRQALRAYLGRQPRERLARWVRQLDEARAELAADGGPQRMSRALEVALLSGRPLSEWHERGPETRALDGVVVVLDLAREELDRRIDARVDRMIDLGFLDEVRRLRAAGHGPEAPGMTATGYRELGRHLDGETTLEEAVAAVRHGTRRFARRQLTWFRNQLPPDAVRLDARLPLDEQVRRVLAAWSEAGGRLPRELATKEKEGR